MKGKLIAVFGLLCALAAEAQARGLTVTIHTDAAQAVLMALQNSQLSLDDALKIARMPGNQGIIRKENEFKIAATTESFARALVATAHNEPVTDPAETAFDFVSLKPRVSKLLDLIKEIARRPDAFQSWIEQRVALFSPPDSNIGYQGYVVAGGDGGGYTFDDPNFYLNIGFEDEFEPAKVTTAHELYHAVQGAYLADRRDAQAAPPAANEQDRQRQRACADTDKLFNEIYKEGSAQYVEDFAALKDLTAPLAKSVYEDRTSGLRHVPESATLLEMSVIGLNARAPVPFDDVYAVGFYGQGVLYNIGYVIAKAIVDSDGPQGLAKYLKRPAYEFALDYSRLPKYGADADHPRLGPNSIEMLQRAHSCPSSPAAAN